jgi:hypothetical protein
MQTRFLEKQYIGYNRLSILLRLLLMLCCFTGYYWSENPNPVVTRIGDIRIGSYPGKDLPQSGELFFLMSCALGVWSIALLFVPHVRIEISEGMIKLQGRWGSRRSQLPVSEVVFVRCVEVPYSEIQRPLLSQKNKGQLRYYTWGDEAVEISLRSGLRLLVGTQRASELVAALRQANPEVGLLEP